MQICLLIDTPNLEPLEPILDALEGQPIRAWIAPAAFISLGPSVVHHLRLAGFDSYLDLRLTGEATSVGRAVEAVRRQGALGVTVDLTAGLAVAKAAVAAAKGRLKIVGVPGSLDAPAPSPDALETARHAGIRLLYTAEPHAAAIDGFQLFVRTDAPTGTAAGAVIGDRLLDAADPGSACDALLTELS